MDGYSVRIVSEKELRRHIRQLEWAVRGAEEELRRDPRQAYNKAFYAWREAIAALAAMLAAGPGAQPLRERLREIGAYEEGEVRVTTSNAPRVLKTLKEYVMKTIGAGHEVYRLLEGLDALRKDAYMLHTAFYEGTEHAGFTGDEEAIKTAHRVIGAAAGILERVKRFIESRVSQDEFVEA